MKLLIVDDAAFVRTTLKQILAPIGFTEMVEASNGEEAVRLYKEHKPKLVTMDLTMPNMDGLTAIRKIRELDPEAVIIVCSSMGQKDMVLEAVKLGAKNFIVKPFEKGKVIASVKALL